MRQERWFLRSGQQQEQAMLRSAVPRRVLDNVRKGADSGVAIPKLRRRERSQVAVKCPTVGASALKDTRRCSGKTADGCQRHQADSGPDPPEGHECACHHSGPGPCECGPRTYGRGSSHSRRATVARLSHQVNNGRTLQAKLCGSRFPYAILVWKKHHSTSASDVSVSNLAQYSTRR